MAKPGSWEWAYLHRGPPGTTPHPAASGPRVDTFPLLGGSRAWIQVDPRYAERHPEAVLNINGKYYRASVPSAAVQYAQARGMTEAEAFAEAKKNALLPFPEQAKIIRQTDLIPADIRSQVERESMGMSALKGETLFNKQVQLGFIPKGSVYISENQYLPASEAKKIMRQSPELYETLTTGGWDAYQAKVEKYQAEYQQWQKQQAEFEQALKADFPDLYRIYKEKGIDAYNAEVKEQQDALEKLKKAGVFSTVLTPWAGLSLLEPFKSGKPSKKEALDMGKVVAAGVSLETINAAGFDISQKTYNIFKDLEAKYKDEEKGGYKLYKYIEDNPKVTPTALYAAGFSKEAVDGAIKYNEVMAILNKPEYQLENGCNLPLAIKRGAVTKADLLAAKFSKKDVDKAAEASKASEDTLVALPGEKTWEFISGPRRGEVVTDEQYRQIVRDYEAEAVRLAKQGKLPTDPHPDNVSRLTVESGRRAVIEAVSFVFPAARAAKPEYTIKDISGVEWGLTGVNAALIGTAFAPGAILGSLPGKAALVGISTTGAGMIGYETAKNWSDLSPTQRAIGVGGTLLYATPLLLTAARGIKIGTVKIPTAEGTKIVYRGLAIAERPIAGRSGGKWVIGAREVTLPEAKLILDGFNPKPMLETKVFVNPKALAKAGWSQTQIDYLVKSLKFRNLFAGKKSAFLSKEALFEPTKYIDTDEMAVFLKQIAKHNKNIKHVDMLYGGTTIKAQLAPKLRAWRQLHDLDMNTTFTLDEAKAFVGETLKLLKRLPGKHQYRISPKSPIRIEKMVDGKWVHMNDLKSELIDPSLQSSEVPGSKLDVTGEYSYGRMVAEPAITVKYPGLGKFDIMSLSEAGVRKADTILRVRQTPEGTAFRPPSRGIAQPGVPKDAADLYVILRTFEESKVLEAGIADEWLEAWAKAMGYTEAELAKVLPNIRKAALEVAAKTPSNLVGYRFTPASTTKVSPRLSPTMSIHIPSSLGASVSPSLAKRISTSVSLYSVASRIRPSVSAAVSKMLPSGSKAGVSPKLSKLSPASISASAKPSPGAVSPKPSPKPSPTTKLSITPKPSPGVTTYPSIKPSPSPSPPSPPPGPESPKPPPPLLRSSKAESDEAKREKFRGAMTWKQGFGWWSVKAPYATKADAAFFKGKPPPNAEIVKGGRESAFRSIQTITGQPPEKLKIDMGIMDITIRKPKKKPGEPGAISFERDVEQETMGDIIITSTGKGEPRVTKETTEEILAISSAKSSKMPKEVALAIGSVSAKVGPDGKPRIKVRRL